MTGVDMRELSYLTGWKTDGNRFIVEGEAGNAYLDLNRFRRTLAWMPGEYVLILDDVQANGSHKIAWQNQSHKADFTNPAEGRGYFEAASGTRMAYQMLANRPITGDIQYHVFYSTKGNTKVQSTQFHATCDTIRFACLLNPWQAEGLSMDYAEQDGMVTVTVRGPGGDDVWSWKPAGDL